MGFRKLKEGLAEILVPDAERIYDAPVFYNPVMALNRDLSVLAVDILEPKRVLDAFSATGIRGIRYALETPAEEIWLNDISGEAFNLILKNVWTNLGLEGSWAGKGRVHFLGEKRVVVNLGDANGLMAGKFRYFDFIDIDPFGSPVWFLDNALRSVKRRGVVALTATDAGVLCGAYRNACRRKYLAEPIRGELCHEAGLRILIGTAVRYAAKYDLGVDVLLAYYRDHYFRAFLKLKSGARKSDESLSSLGYLWQDASGEFEYLTGTLPGKPGPHGPLWLGPLKDEDFTREMLKRARDKVLSHKKTLPFLKTLVEELDVPFLYDTHALARRNGLEVGRLEGIIETLRELGYRATRTHFSPTALKTDAPFREVLKAMGG
ncbi:tRNA (guanine(10)-N(2))-dimethyltransferase [Thermococcus sp. P6]|uniref:tRNA (guanine(10)-N(2))-dimethyltransferase n=1 Tax=Thermococcus sp. P6 TaxID=122420 RepID=UPI000B59BD79|nr:tRNA (guanine(10)-N(2))-dimethyltransferase [Thermococcus sp. P6]ASJ10710.1 tRNA (guanine(10)-N(2))-dimethyltransferase [Thermococcus sp. P6]